jgi:hypothetical protein
MSVRQMGRYLFQETKQELSNHLPLIQNPALLQHSTCRCQNQRALRLQTKRAFGRTVIID